eukprot:c8107_g1_i1.p1 GENE.c8107_g1_i1~~c8107_g1_i1.p1  ORF type:complete len:564 (-),score=177.76 c8107_g1_i1:302-1942(-)
MGQNQSNPTDDSEPTSGSGPVTPNNNRSLTRISARDAPPSPSDQLSDEMHELNSRLASFLRDIGSLETRKVMLEDQLERERELKAAALQELRDRAEKEVGDLKKYCEHLQSQNRQLQNDLKNEQTRGHARLASAHQAHIEALEKQRTELQSAHSSELDQVRADTQAHSERSQARLTSELENTRNRLEAALEEFNRLKRSAREDPDTAVQLARLRRENAELQQQLSIVEERHANKQEELAQSLKDAYTDIQRLNLALHSKERQLKETQESNTALFKEVSFFRSLLDKEIARITPSKTAPDSGQKSKKRRLGAESIFTSSPSDALPPPTSSSSRTNITLPTMFPTLYPASTYSAAAAVALPAPPAINNNNSHVIHDDNNNDNGNNMVEMDDVPSSSQETTAAALENLSKPAGATPHKSKRSTIQVTIDESNEYFGGGPVRISSLDARGEVVTITNTTDEHVVIGGWILRAEKARKDYKFAVGKVILPKASIRVLSGKFNESAMFDDNTLWWSRSNVWDKRSEIAVLIDHNETVVSSLPVGRTASAIAL